MSVIFKKLLALSLIGGMLSSCTNEAGEINKQQMLGIAGAVGGGVIGSNIGKGKGRTAAIIGGTLIGALAGSELGKSLDKADVAYQNRAQTQALESNKSGSGATWKNPDSGASGTITPTKTYEKAGRYCREYTQTINVGGKTEKGYGTACRQPDGAWEVIN